jgi:CBS domain containing-hemolysin-like protein
MATDKKPWGILILGGINFFILGILFFLVSFIAYTKFSPQDLEKLFNKADFPARVNSELTPAPLKVALLSQMAISLIFIVSGLGVLLRKEWARKTTIYFSFSLVLLTFLSVLFYPALIKQLILQIAYLGTLIFYFTNKKVEEHFISLDDKSLFKKET